MKIQRIVICLIIIFSAQSVSARDDFQYWNQMSLKLCQQEKIDFIMFTDARFMHDAEKLGLYFISPKVVYHYSKNLDFGINYTYLQSRKTSPDAIDDSYKFQHWVELEVNPQWLLRKWLKLKMRNRVEFRWIEDQGSDNTRYRQRWMFELPFMDAAFVKSIYTSSEFFYAFHRYDINENRSVPLGLVFKITDKVDLNLYYMIQSQKGTKDWMSNQILGTLIAVDF